MQWAVHLVPSLPEDFGQRLLHIIVQAHSLDVLLGLSAHGVRLHVILEPVNLMLLQIQLQVDVSMYREV
jgi:hypothetical protein